MANHAGPVSQMQATMRVEPSQDKIDELIAITGLSVDHARRYLKVKRNDVNAAANALFDGEDISKAEQAETWDESAWNADREGNTEQHLAPLTGHSNAPTRRPSPAPSLGIKPPGNQAAEDDELQQAILLSQGRSFQQETGIRTRDGQEKPSFGPATKAYYDEQQWGLTIAQEVVPDVPARERKHTVFEPRSLKYLPSGDYLPSLLSICHAIPLARTALLMSDFAQADYGYDPDWWRGHKIAMPRIVHTADGRPADPNTDKYDEFIAEVQRIMAILDSSDRSYATIGALLHTDLMDDGNANHLETFLRRWVEAACSKVDDEGAREQVSEVFRTLVGTTDRLGMDTPHMTVVDMDFAKMVDGQTINLIELMDNFLWDTADESNMADNYIQHPASIIVMKLKQANPSMPDLGVEVPPAIYIDKYLKDNVAASKEVRQSMARGRKRVARIEAIEKKLQHWQHPTNGTQLDARQLLKHTLGHFSGQNRRDADDADLTDSPSLAEHEQTGYAEIVAQLETVIAAVDDKLKLLAEEKDKIRKAISDMSQAPLPALEENGCKHRYTLRGVATKPNITYILQRRDPADTGPQLEEGTAPEGFEWWRVQYEVTGQSAKINTTRMADYDVLRAAELEHTSALLVYASDAATDPTWDTDGLPDGLTRFVAQDNRRLHEELAAEVEPPPYSNLTEYDIPRTSIERRDSMDSMKNMGSYSPNHLPDYMDEDNARQHHGYGLGYDVKGRQSDNVHEIHLDESGSLLGGMREVEMVQAKHPPLVPKAGASNAASVGSAESSRNDVAMGGVESQDGTLHVEDAEMKSS